ncbi:MAG: hypothetical protein ACN2B6_08980 [Rickettsiales bacterium]
MSDHEIPNISGVEKILGKGSVTNMAPHVQRLAKDSRPTEAIARDILDTKFTVDGATMNLKAHCLQDARPEGELEKKQYDDMKRFLDVITAIAQGETPTLSSTDKYILKGKLDYFTELQNIAEQIGVRDSTKQMNALNPNASDTPGERERLMAVIAESKGLSDSYSKLVENLSIINERLGIGQQSAMSI